MIEMENSGRQRKMGQRVTRSLCGNGLCTHKLEKSCSFLCETMLRCSQYFFMCRHPNVFTSSNVNNSDRMSQPCVDRARSSWSWAKWPSIVFIQRETCTSNWVDVAPRDLARSTSSLSFQVQQNVQLTQSATTTDLNNFFLFQFPHCVWTSIDHDPAEQWLNKAELL